MSTINLIIVLPGTTGSTLVKSQGSETSSYPYWLDGVSLEIDANDLAGAEAGLTGTLWAGRPLGSANNNSVYYALISSIVDQANSFSKHNNYSSYFSNWPTVDYGNITDDFSWFSSSNVLSTDAVIGFAYDWRQNNTISALMLQSMLAALNKANSIGTIWFVAHSMGGLVARAYLEAIGSGDAWFSKIQGLVTLGTPHLGAPLALSAITNSWPDTGDGSSVATRRRPRARPYPLGNWPDSGERAGPRQTDMSFDQKLDTVIQYVVNSSMGISSYELLPTAVSSDAAVPNQNFVTYLGSTYSMADLPSAVTDALASLNFNAGNESASVTFFKSLTYTGKTPVPYTCIYGVVTDADGDGQDLETVTSFSVTETDNVFSFTPVEVDGGGDTVVPIFSASFGAAGGTSTFSYPSVTAVEVSNVTHLEMPENTDIQAAVNNALGFGQTAEQPALQAEPLTAAAS